MDYFKLLQNNDIESLIKYLKNHDANEEIQGQSLLYWAVYMGNVEFSNILIEKGANVNQKDGLGRTPLSITSFFGFLEIAKLLLKNGAIIDASCMDRAYFGWGRNVQSDVLDLFQKYGWLNIYLDDLREIPKGFKGARTIEEAISIMEQSTVHMLSLDHDLGVDEEGDLLPTGYDLVKYMCENGLRANRIYIHTDNVVGRENMYQTLLAARRRGFIDNDIEVCRHSITVNRYTES